MKTLTAMLLSKTDCIPSIYHKESVDESGLRVEVITSERNVRMATLIGLREQSLHNIDLRRCEGVRRCRHVEPPHTESMISDKRERVVPLLFERAYPVAKRHRVVLAQALDVPRFKSRSFCRRDHIVRGRQLPIWKNVLVDECVGPPERAENSLADRSRPCFAKTDDSVIHEQPAGLEGAISRCEIHRQVTEPDVLDHSYAGDLVVAVTCGECAVISYRHSAAIAQARLLDALSRQHSLILAERASRGIDSVVLRGVHDQRAPPTPNVEETLPRLETQLPTDQIQLGLLRGVERIIRRAEVRARIDHSLVEPELVEAVADIVVELDRRGITHRCVSLPELPCVSRKPRVGEIVFCLSRKADQQSDQFGNRDWRPQSLTDGLAKVGCRFHAAVDVDIACDIGFHDRQLVRRQQHPTKRGRSVENQREGRIRIGAAIDGPVPESHVERSLPRIAEQRSQYCATTRCCPVVEQDGGRLELYLYGRHS